MTEHPTGRARKLRSVEIGEPSVRGLSGIGKIIVPALPTERAMEELLQSLIDDNDSNFSNALDHDVSHIDQRAQVHAVRVTQVDIRGSEIELIYELQYSIYRGCADMDVVDSEELHVFGDLIDKGWAFDEYVPPPKRDTVNEF